MAAVRTTAFTPSAGLIRALDTGGLVLSALCAVHCALTPVLIAVLPLMGWHTWEWPLRLGAVGVGVVAVGLGAFFHRTARVVWPLLVGVALVAVASTLHDWLIAEVLVSIAASAALMRAHWLNTRACAKVCHDCPPARLARSNQ